MPNPFVNVTVTVAGVRPTIVAMSAETTAFADRVTAGLIAAAKEVQAKARANMRTHHYEGRAEQKTTVQVHIRSVNFVQVTVGIHGNDFAPEGKTFEVGWRSTRGLIPPVAPLAEWALRRHLTSDPNEAQHIGFVIARKMGESGYSFGEFHWLTDAWADAQPAALATVERYANSFWASQPRVPAGSAGAGRFMS